MIGTFLVLALAAFLSVTLAKSMFQIVKVEPNTVYVSKEGKVKWIVLNKIEDMVTLASPDYNIRINVSIKQLQTEFTKLETLWLDF